MNIDEADLPDEMQTGRGSYVQADEAVKDPVLQTVSEAIKKLRDDAMTGRRASGIEEVWRAADEAYRGIDDANRNQAGARFEKPTNSEGPLTSKQTVNSLRSTVFVPLTRRYVDIATAKVCEMTDPIDDRPFSIKPTPVPTLTEAVGDQTPLKDAAGAQVYRPLANGEQPTQPLTNGMVPATVGEHAKALMDKADKAAKGAEDQIYDWMVEAKYAYQKRRMVFDAAKLGTGVLKGPFPTFSKGKAKLANGKIVRDQKLVPGKRRISPWNFYPDPACGENIHDGAYCFEKDNITESKLLALKSEKLRDGTPVYIGSQIDKVIEEGPHKSKQSQNPKDAYKKKLPYEIWYFTGVLNRKDIEALDQQGLLKDLPTELTLINVVVTMVNDDVIRIVRNPLDSGAFGYHVMKWCDREDESWAGMGIAEQVDMPQKGVNAGTRAWFNNAGLASGIQVLIDTRQIAPKDGIWALTPNKIWELTADATTDDIRKVFQSVEFPDLGAQLQKLIEYNFKLAEEATNIPLVTQGRDSETTPQTFGQAELQNSNAHALLRMIARRLSDQVEEPLIGELYDWLLLDDTVPDELKGDFEIDATGSIVIMEKAIQEQVLAQLLGVALNQAYGLNPAKIAEEYVKSKRILPSLVQYTDDEKRAMAQQPPPKDPAVEAAQIRAASAEKIALGHDNATVQKSKLDTDRDTIYADAERARAESAANVRLQELHMKLQLAQLDYANLHSLKLEDVKAKLADTAMRLNVQRELSQADLAADLHKHHNPGPVITPPTEPAGRAEAGHAFQQ